MYRKFLVAVIAVAMLATVAAPAFADSPVPGGDSASGEAITEGLPPATDQVGSEGVINIYAWLNLARSVKWSLAGKSDVVSQAYNASSAQINKMIVKNKLCKGGSCTVWTKTAGSNLVWAWAGWWRKGGRTNWTTRGIHTFIHGGAKKTYNTIWGAPL